MILRIATLIGGLLMMSNLHGQRLDQYKWQNRILLIETTNKTNLNYKNQIKEFINLEAELADRKLIVYELVGDQYKKTDYLARENNSEWAVRKTINKSILSRTAQFKVTLIGLDGGIKMEKEEVVKKEKLFGLIDTMPMRRWELENRNNE